MDEIEKITNQHNVQAGNLHALTLLVLQIAKQVPDKEKLLSDFKYETEKMIAAALNSQLPESVVASFQDSATQMHLAIQNSKDHAR